MSELRFIDAATSIITTVRFIVDGSEDYPDIDEVADVAGNIAGRVLADDSTPEPTVTPTATNTPTLTPAP